MYVGPSRRRLRSKHSARWGVITNPPLIVAPLHTKVAYMFSLLSSSSCASEAPVKLIVLMLGRTEYLTSSPCQAGTSHFCNVIHSSFLWNYTSPLSFYFDIQQHPSQNTPRNGHIIWEMNRL